MSVYPEARYLLIEPQVAMADKLDQLCRQNRNVEYVLSGAGSKEGALVQTIYEDPRGSTFVASAGEAQVRSGKQRETKVVIIDSLLQERGFPPDLVKLDIQGYELEALKGASLCFGRTEVFILETSLFHFYETMPTTREVIQFMADRGYELYDITEFLRRPYDGALGQVDLAFAKATGFLRSSSRWV